MGGEAEKRHKTSGKPVDTQKKVRENEVKSRGRLDISRERGDSKVGCLTVAVFLPENGEIG